MMTKDILLTLTYLVGAGELALAVFFWVTHSKSEIRKVMALLSFSTGMWVVIGSLTTYTHPTSLIVFLVSTLYVFGVFLSTALVHLAIVFPFPLIRFDRLHSFLLYVPAILFSVIALSTRTIVSSYDVNPTIPGVVISGPLHHLFNYYILALFIICLALLLQKIIRTDGIHKKNATTVFWSILLGGGLPVWYDLLVPNLFPQFTQSNYLYGDLATVIWLGITTFIVLQK